MSWKRLRRLVLLVMLALSAGAATPPRAEARQQTPDPVPPVAPVAHTYREIDGTALKAYVFGPARTAPTGRVPGILLFHGGGWVAGSPEWTFASARRYAGLGWVAISIQYRLSEGGTSPIEALADVCEAFQWVRAQSKVLGVDPMRVAASGVSAGGHLAAAAATIGCGNTGGEYGNGGPDALVLWSPAVDVQGDGHFRRLLGARAPVEAYSPVAHVRPRMPPAHIVQGDRDTLTPLAGARRFCDLLRSGGGRCELVVYPGVGHLLTRNLSNQESDFDPDPVAREEGNNKQLAFMKSLWQR